MSQGLVYECFLKNYVFRYISIILRAIVLFLRGNLVETLHINAYQSGLVMAMVSLSSIPINTMNFYGFLGQLF